MDKFVLHVPKWQGQMIFSKEILVFLGVILLTIVGTLFCFWGYKYFRTILFLGIGTVVCYLSYLLAEPMTTNLAVRMFLTVSLTLFGLVFLYFLDIVFVYFLDKLRLRDALEKHVYLLAALLGAMILGLTAYHFIWRDAVTVAVFSAVCLTGGLVFQYFNRKKQVRFKCYNDLLKMPLPKMEMPEPEAEPVMLAAEPEPETEAEPESEEAIEPAVSEPEAEAEPIMLAAEPEPEIEAEPESEEAIEAAVSEPEAGAEPVMLAIEPEPQPSFVPVAEMHLKPVSVAEEAASEKDSGGIRYLILRKSEQEEELIEDALFVRKMKEDVMAWKQSGQLDIGLAVLAAARHTQAVSEAQETYEVSVKTMAAAARGTDSRRRRAHKKPRAGKRISGKEYARRERRIVHGVTVAIAGLGIFLAGRASKRKD